MFTIIVYYVLHFTVAEIISFCNVDGASHHLHCFAQNVIFAPSLAHYYYDFKMTSDNFRLKRNCRPSPSPPLTLVFVVGEELNFICSRLFCTVLCSFVNYLLYSIVSVPIPMVLYGHISFTYPGQIIEFKKKYE